MIYKLLFLTIALSLTITGCGGAKGPTGPVGIDGIQGLDGGPGPTGPAGPIGIAGPQGEMGDQGPTGDDYVQIAPLYPHLPGIQNHGAGGQRTYTSHTIEHSAGAWSQYNPVTNTTIDLDPRAVSAFDAKVRHVRDFVIYRNINELPTFPGGTPNSQGANSSVYVSGPILSSLPTGTLTYSAQGYGYHDVALYTTSFTTTIEVNMGMGTGTLKGFTMRNDTPQNPNLTQIVSEMSLTIDLADGTFRGSNITGSFTNFVAGSFHGTADDSSMSGVVLIEETNSGSDQATGAFVAYPPSN